MKVDTVNRAGLLAPPRVIALAKFLLVGLSGIAVNEIVYVGLVDKLAVWFVLAAIISTEASTTWNFLGNEHWAFRGRRFVGPTWVRYLAYAVMNNALLVFRVPILWVLSTFVHLGPASANLIALGALFVMRFALSDGWIWRKKGENPYSEESDSTVEGAPAFRYDIGGLIQLHSDAELPELAYFRTAAVADPDIRIRIRRVGFGFQPRVRLERDGDRVTYREHLGILGADFNLTLGHPIEIEAAPLLAMSRHVLYTNVVEALLRFVLVSKGYVLLHSAGMEADGKATLLSAQTDTGKTSTVINLIRERGWGFISDDMAIIDPAGKVLTFPKPMTLSYHTMVRAIDEATLGVKQRLQLQVQSRVHSKSGRSVGKGLGSLNVPIMSINSVVQLVVPPPKYHITSLLPTRIAAEVPIANVFLMERGEPVTQRVPLEEAIDQLIDNTDDAYGFPPFATLAPNLVIDGMDYPTLRARERELLTRAMSDAVIWRVRVRGHEWGELLPRLMAGDSEPVGTPIEPDTEPVGIPVESDREPVGIPIEDNGEVATLGASITADLPLETPELRETGKGSSGSPSGLGPLVGELGAAFKRGGTIGPEPMPAADAYLPKTDAYNGREYRTDASYRPQSREKRSGFGGRGKPSFRDGDSGSGTGDLAPPDRSRRAAGASEALAVVPYPRYGLSVPVAGVPAIPNFAAARIRAAERLRANSLFLVALAAILLLGTFVRLWGIWAVGFNNDEAVYAGQGAALAADPVYSGLFAIFRAHPLLVQFLYSIAFRFFGVGDIWPRVISVAFGLAAISLAYATGSVLYNRRVGLIAAAILAVMPYHVVVTRQALLDGPETTLFLLSMYMLSRYARHGGASWLYGAAFVTGLTVLAKETAVLIVPVAVAFLLLVPEVHIPLRRQLLAVAIFLVAMSPYPAAILIGKATNTAGSFVLWEILRQPNHPWTFYAQVLPTAMGPLVFIAGLLGFAYALKRGGWEDRLLFCWIAVPATFFEIWPVKGYQYLLPIAPAVAILAGLAFDRLIVWAGAYTESRREVDDAGRPEESASGPAEQAPARRPLIRRAAAGVSVLLALVTVLSVAIPSVLAVNTTSMSGSLAGTGGLPGGREAGTWIRDNVPAGAAFLTTGPTLANIVEFYGQRRAYGLSVSPNPLRRNPAYDPINNPDRALQLNEIQYIATDIWSAQRSPYFDHLLRSYISRYHGHLVYQQTALTLDGSGGISNQVVIQIYEVRP